MAPDHRPPSQGASAADLALAFATGGLLTAMTFLNGWMGALTTAFFASLAAHGAGTLAAAGALGAVALRQGLRRVGRAPWWSYLAGLAGAATVVLTSVAVNSPLALAGTLALGLAGQMVFGLAADALGLFGLPQRRPSGRDLGAAALVAGGSFLLIFQAGGAP